MRYIILMKSTGAICTNGSGVFITNQELITLQTIEVEMFIYVMHFAVFHLNNDVVE